MGRRCVPHLREGGKQINLVRTESDPAPSTRSPCCFCPLPSLESCKAANNIPCNYHLQPKKRRAY